MPRAPQKLFIDTGAFLAWELERDQYYEIARRRWGLLADSAIRLYSSEHVLDETLTLLGRRSSYAHAANRGADYLRSESLEILQTSEEDWPRALKAMTKYADQGVSCTDCLSFVLMKREKIRSVFTFDRHFAAAGFAIWEP